MKFKVYRITIDFAGSSESAAESEAERMCDSAPYSETEFGSKVVCVEEVPRAKSAFAGDEMLEAFEKDEPGQRDP